MARLAFFLFMLSATTAFGQARHADHGPIPAYDQTTDLGKAMAICRQFTVPMLANARSGESGAFHYDDAHWKRCDAIQDQWEKTVGSPAAAAAAAQRAADESLLDTVSKAK